MGASIPDVTVTFGRNWLLNPAHKIWIAHVDAGAAFTSAAQAVTGKPA